jgi:general secretion pathway protein G
MRVSRHIHPTGAFTLVELLIVVVILAILAALAMVNHQLGVARSRVARVQTDMRPIATALETYRTDHNAYPPSAEGDIMLVEPLRPLLTPVAYLSSIPADPFGPAPLDFMPAVLMPGYSYKERKTTSVGMPADTFGELWHELPDKEFLLHSCGPNRVWDVTPYVEYDPTNGVVSGGDICRFGPM